MPGTQGGGMMFGVKPLRETNPSLEHFNAFNLWRWNVWCWLWRCARWWRSPLSCKIGKHKFSAGESGYGFGGYMDWFCARRNCGKLFMREPFEDAKQRLSDHDNRFYNKAIKEKIEAAQCK